MNRQEVSAAAAIGLLYLVRMLGLFMVLPVLPLIEDEVPGATPFLIGIAVGVYGLSQGFLQIPFGRMSDRFGRKPVIAAGLVVFIAGSFIAAFSDDMTGVIIGRFLQGCGAIASTLMALMADLTRIDQRARSMAIIGIAIAGSFGLSLILGPAVAAGYGINGVFMLAGCLGLLCLPILFLVVPTPTAARLNLDSAVQRQHLRSAVTDNGLWRLNLGVFCLHFLLVSGFAAFPLLLEGTAGIERDNHSMVYLALLCGSFVLMAPVMWMSDRIANVRHLLLVTVAISLVAFLVLRQGQGYWSVLAGIVLFFMSFNLLEVFLPAQVSKLSAAGLRGTAMGVYTSSQFLGIFAGGVVSGWILLQGDIADLMTANMVLTVIWLGVILGFPSTSHLSSRTVALGNIDELTAQQRLDALLSLEGVLDAVVIESDRVAYLKVDEKQINEARLNELVAGSGDPEATAITGEAHGSRN